jgi:DNA repair exonuclease SbcCD nuclease subunit
MARILHVSDTHLDYRQYQNDERRQDYADAFNHVIDIAIEENVDAVLHTGDLFHDKSPSLGSQIQCAEIIQRLETEPPEEIPFLTIVGNHERKRDYQFVDYLELPNSHLVQLDNEENTPYVVNDDVAIYGFDYIPTPSWESTDLTLTPPEKDCFILVAMHQLLHPPVPEIMAQHNTEDVLDRFGIDIDALALGDYHQREQARLNGTRVWYPGSTEKTKEDDGPNHYVDILDFDGSELNRRIRREIPTREFLFIDIDLVEGVSPTEQIQRELDAYDVQDKVVHITLDGADVSVTKSQVEDLLRDRNVTVGRCSDARTEFEIDVDAVETEVQNINAAVDEELGNLDLSTTAQEVEQIVRNLNTPKSHVRAQADEIVKAAAPSSVQEDEADAEDAVLAEPSRDGDLLSNGGEDA